MKIDWARWEKARRAWRFAADGVWDIELSSLSALPSLGVKALRVIHLVFRGFREDECPLHASALTFSTLMAIVPVLALSLALARGLGDPEIAKDKIRSAVYDWTEGFKSGGVSMAELGDRGGEVVSSNGAGWPTDPGLSPEQLAGEINDIVERVFEEVENVRFGAIGGVGLVILLWMVVQVLGKVELSFNRVWGVTVGRSMWRRFTDYLSVTVLIVVVSSIPVADFVTRYRCRDGRGLLLVRDHVHAQHARPLSSRHDGGCRGRLAVHPVDVALRDFAGGGREVRDGIR